MRRRTRRTTRSLGLIVLLAVAAIAALNRLQGSDLLSDTAQGQVTAPSAATAPLPQALAELVVDDDHADVPSYDRDAFGPAWTDVDHDGCDQRNNALAAHMSDVTYRAGTHDCVVETGTFTDLYTGQSRPFIKSDDGGHVDIDHLVPLSAAWQAGAWTWDDATRTAYANDLTVLVPTDSSLNRSKGDQDPTSWLPPADGGYVCPYLERWVQLKTTWHLTVTTGELHALQEGLAQCA